MTDDGGGAADIQERHSRAWLWLRYLNIKPEAVGGGLILAFGLVFGGFSGWALYGEAGWAVFGVWADGTVAARRQVGVSRPGLVVAGVLFAHGGGSGPRFRVTVDYTDAAGNRQTGTLFVRGNGGPHPGAPVRVMYRPDDPGRLSLGPNWMTLTLLPVFVMAGLGLVALAVAVTFTGVRDLGRLVRLVRRTEYETRGSGRRSTRVGVIEYEFLHRPAGAADDALGTGRLEVSGRPPKSLVAGGPVVVLLDPADPASNTPDLFDARRADRERLFGPAAGSVSSEA